MLSRILPSYHKSSDDESFEFTHPKVSNTSSVPLCRVVRPQRKKKSRHHQSLVCVPTIGNFKGPYPENLGRSKTPRFASAEDDIGVHVVQSGDAEPRDAVHELGVYHARGASRKDRDGEGAKKDDGSRRGGREKGNSTANRIVPVKVCTFGHGARNAATARKRENVTRHVFFPNSFARSRGAEACSFSGCSDGRDTNRVTITLQKDKPTPKRLRE